MTRTEKRCYITFPALSQVLQAEKSLSTSGLRFWIVPIPREISSDCGMCIMCCPGEFQSVKDVLSSEDINYEETFELEKKKLKLF